MYGEIRYNEFTINKQTKFSKIKSDKRITKKTIEKLNLFFEDTPILLKNDYKNQDVISMIIPNDKIIIDEYAFHSYNNLKSIILPSKLERIGFKSFLNCLRLEKIEIPDTVTTIEDFAFSGCSSLKNIKLSDNIQHIGNYAFNFCDKLQSIEYQNEEYTNPEEFNKKMKELNISTEDVWIK